MTFEIRETTTFARHRKNLRQRFNLSKTEARAVINELNEALDQLEESGSLPETLGYQLHTLADYPWTGYMEFHISDNILVVYADLHNKSVIRLIGIYNHEMLRSGRID